MYSSSPPHTKLRFNLDKQEEVEVVTQNTKVKNCVVIKAHITH